MSPTQNATSESIISQICGLLHKMFLFHSPNSGTSKSKAQLSINGEFKTAVSSHMLLHILYSGKPHTTFRFQHRLGCIRQVKGQTKNNCPPTPQHKDHKRLGGDWQNEINSVYSKPSKRCTSHDNHNNADQKRRAGSHRAGLSGSVCRISVCYPSRV